MKNLILFVSLFALFLLPTAIPASATESVGRTNARTSSFEPCRWWRYDSQTGNYTCSSKEFRITVYESREVDQIVRGLEGRIQSLEDRVRKLEQAP